MVEFDIGTNLVTIITLIINSILIPLLLWNRQSSKQAHQELLDKMDNVTPK